MITADRRDDVALLTIDRHERRNALDLEHATELLAALRGAVDDGARCVVVTGAGSSFCSGADLDQVYGEDFRAALAALLRGLAAVPVPVVAAVNGPAVGAGTQIAVACDLRIVDERARFAVPTARNGLAVDPWTVARLADVAGGGVARALLLGVDTVSAERALTTGLADRAGTLDDALAWAAELATLAPLSLAYSKLALNGADRADVDAAFAACWVSSDVQEYRAARAEGRPPRFTGR
ncbi:enoyl-CoA hydratase [Jatrophihabitans sp. YIM 134969]